MQDNGRAGHGKGRGGERSLFHGQVRGSKAEPPFGLRLERPVTVGELPLHAVADVLPAVRLHLEGERKDERAVFRRLHALRAGHQMRRIAQGEVQGFCAVPVLLEFQVALLRVDRFSVDQHLPGPEGDADGQRKIRILCLHGDVSAKVEGILAVDPEKHGLSADVCVHAAGQEMREHESLIGLLDRTHREFRPSLAHVGRAAAVVGLKAEHMGFTAVGAEKGLSGEGDTGDLVDHLVILVSPHVLGEGGRQRVEGGLFQPVGPDAVPGHAVEPFKAVHHFDHGAQLGALLIAKA